MFAKECKYDAMEEGREAVIERPVREVTAEWVYTNIIWFKYYYNLWQFYFTLVFAKIWSVKPSATMIIFCAHIS